MLVALDQLDDAALAALDAIVSAPEAWSVWGEIEAAHPGQLGRLEGLGLVERWERPDYVAATLTPYGAALAEVWVSERLHWVSRDVGEGPDPKYRREPEVYPVWAGEDTPHADPDPSPAELLLFPNRVIDRRAVAYLRDESGEVVTLWGMPVPVSRGRKHR